MFYPIPFFMRGVVPLLGGVILLGAFLQAAHDYWLAGPDADSTTSWTIPFPPHWEIGGIFLTGIGALLLGVVLMVVAWITMPSYFRGETVPKRTAEQLTAHLLPGDAD